MPRSPFVCCVPSYPLIIPGLFSSFTKTQYSDMYANSIHMYANSIHMNLLAQILSSQVRAEIFRLLFNRDKSSIYLRDLERKSGFSIRTIQNEITHLKDLDLINSEPDGNRIYYSANSDHPLYPEICGLVEKTSGIKENLKQILSSLTGIQCAFIFGSFAKGEEKSHSDIDIIIIGDIGLRTISPALKSVTEKALREINPHVYSMKSWKQKLNKKDHFIRSVMKEKKVFLIGDENVIS